MKFQVSSAGLLKALMDIFKAVPVKSPSPILENFLFVLKGTQLELTASDSELTLRTVIEVISSDEDGSMAVPARNFLDLLKEIPDQPLDICSAGDSSFECRWISGNSQLPYFPAEDYPEIKLATEGATTVNFPAKDLVEGISGTVYATADDEIRPAMNGIFFDIDTDSTTLVASDSHKLICYTTKAVSAPEKASFILHKKPAAIIRQIVSKDGEDVKVTFNENTVMFSFDKTLIVCRLIIGKYPRYRDVIPKNNSNILKIDRVQFLNTVRRIAVCANKASNHIKFALAPGQVEITAQDLGFSIAAYEKVNCDYSGSAFSIGFKSTFLIEILSNMACDEVVMKFADARRAALIVPAEEEAEKEKVCGILMPIMIS